MDHSNTPTLPLEQTCASNLVTYPRADCGSTSPMTTGMMYQTPSSMEYQRCIHQGSTDTQKEPSTLRLEEGTTDTWYPYSSKVRFDPTYNKIQLPGKSNVFGQTSESTSGKEPRQTTASFGSTTYPLCMDQHLPTI